MHKDDNKVRAFTFSKSDGVGFSVRCIKDNTVTDLDGNVYKSILIGSQTWMAENLKTTKYNDGTSIPLVSDTTSWSNLSTPAYCWYKNHEVNKDAFGALYNWYPNTGATNETGFSARAGGYRFSSPSAFFTQLGYLGCWWSTTEIDKNWAYNLLMYFNSKKVQRLFITEGTGMSVRCVKD